MLLEGPGANLKTNLNFEQDPGLIEVDAKSEMEIKKIKPDFRK